jgi:hypothetical protein
MNDSSTTDVLKRDQHPGTTRVCPGNRWLVTWPHASVGRFPSPPSLHPGARAFCLVPSCLRRPQRRPVPLSNIPDVRVRANDGCRHPPCCLDSHWRPGRPEPRGGGGVPERAAKGNQCEDPGTREELKDTSVATFADTDLVIRSHPPTIALSRGPKPVTAERDSTYVTVVF